MARGTTIEWADDTWSPWWGCTEISEGCKNCYAREQTHGAWGNHPRKRTSRDYWRQPVYRNADAPRFQRQHGHRERVFGGHICDWFDNQAEPEWRAEAWKLVRATPNRYRHRRAAGLDYRRRRVGHRAAHDGRRVGARRARPVP